MTTILLAEDDDLMREIVAERLEEAGYVVDAAANGEEALSMFDVARHDLVITDLVMPRQDGIGVILALRGKPTDVPIIAVSGGGIEGPDVYLRSAQSVGANATLIKPFHGDELLSTVRELMSCKATA